MHRRLVAGLERHPEGFSVHLPTLAQEIGLGAGTSRNAPIIRTLARLVDFRLAKVLADRLGVATVLPLLTARQIARLPPHLAIRYWDEVRLVGPRPTTSKGRPAIGVELES